MRKLRLHVRKEVKKAPKNGELLSAAEARQRAIKRLLAYAETLDW